MGGMLPPLLLGQREAIKIGLQSELRLYDHAKTLNFEELDGNYLLGYGIGFEKGQRLREHLASTDIDIDLDEKARLIAARHELYWLNFDKFVVTSLEFSDNQREWANFRLPPELRETSSRLLQANKLQQALDKVREFYEGERRLIALADFEEISSELKKTREGLAKGEISTDDGRHARVRIKVLLENWLKSN
jgi:hypothetical protein